MSFHVVEKIGSIFGKKANAPKAHDTPTSAKDGRTVHVCQQPEASTTANNKELEANLNELKQLKQTIAKTQKEIDDTKNEIAKYKNGGNSSPMAEERKRAIDKLIKGTEAIEAENEESLKKIKANKKIIIKNSTQKIYLH